MSNHTVKVPALPESVADATVLKWHKQPGEQVGRDENLVDLETDKVVLEVTATTDGILGVIEKPEGDTVVADDVLATLSDVASTSRMPATPQPAAPIQSAAGAQAAGAPIMAGPGARRMLHEHAIEANGIQGTGKGGRVMKEDVSRAINNTATESNPGFSLPGREEKRVPMSRLRAKIAERLVQAQQTAAMLTTFNEVNLQAVMDLRKHYQKDFEKKHGVRLGFMSFFTKAVIAALKHFPSVNASIDGDDIVYHGYYDIGIAVSTERGLVVPVLRDCGQKNMGEIELAINDYAARARDNKLSMEEMTGGTFTITNGGVFGSLLSTPILNPPQTGILGMHKIEQRAVVEEGQVVARPMMYVALSYDHRLIDGKESVQFLATIKHLLEDPARFLLEI